MVFFGVLKFIGHCFWDLLKQVCLGIRVLRQERKQVVIYQVAIIKLKLYLTCDQFVSGIQTNLWLNYNCELASPLVDWK